MMFKCSCTHCEWHWSLCYKIKYISSSVSFFIWKWSSMELDKNIEQIKSVSFGCLIDVFLDSLSKTFAHTDIFWTHWLSIGFPCHLRSYNVSALMWLGGFPTMRDWATTLKIHCPGKQNKYISKTLAHMSKIRLMNKLWLCSYAF